MNFATLPHIGALYLYRVEDKIMAARRGFAAMEENQRRQIASRGGRAAHQTGNAHEWNEHEAAVAGRKGGQKVSQNREHMAAIGRKGGLAAHQRTDQQFDAQTNPPQEMPRQDHLPANGTAHLPAPAEASEKEPAPMPP
jgi:uncharacterized protein